MLKSKSLIFLFLFFGVLFFSSCEDEEIQEQLDHQIQSRNADSSAYYLLNLPFFNDTFVENQLEIQPRVEGIFEDLAQLKIHLAQIPDITFSAQNFADDWIYPAWSLSEPFYFSSDFIQYYTPAFNIQSEQLEGILVSRYKDSAPRFYYFSKSLVDQIALNKPSKFSDYWGGIMEYFDGPLTNERFLDLPIMAMITDNSCKRSNTTRNCYCEKTGGDCYNPDIEDCDDTMCPNIGDDPGDDPGDGSGDDGVYGHDEWNIFIISNELDPQTGGSCCNTGDGSTGSTPHDCHVLDPNMYTPYPEAHMWQSGDGIYCSEWDQYILGFNCDNALGYDDWPDPDDHPSDSGGDGGSDDGKLILVTNTGSLFNLHLDIIIDRYNLDMTAEELRDQLGSNCDLSNYQDVENYTKWNLIEDLSETIPMRDQDKWCLFRNMEHFDDVLTGTGTNLPDCVQDMMVCQQNMTNIKAGYGLSNDEVLNYSSGCDCSDNYVTYKECVLEAGRDHVISVLSELVLPPENESEFQKILDYISAVGEATCSGCYEYEDHCGFIGNWLEDIQGDPTVTIGEVYDMGVWTKMLRDEMIGKILLVFGDNILSILDVAAWEYDLAVSLRFFKAVPLSARNFGMTRMVTTMSTPISSFSTLIHAQKYGIQSYDDLVRLFQDLGWTRTGKSVEFHHLIEQRFKDIPNVSQWMGSANPNHWNCIVVAKGAAEHTPKFTTPWRQAIGYGNTPGWTGKTTTTATIDDIRTAAREIYKDYPEILLSLGL